MINAIAVTHNPKGGPAEKLWICCAVNRLSDGGTLTYWYADRLQQDVSLGLPAKDVKQKGEVASGRLQVWNSWELLLWLSMLKTAFLLHHEPRAAMQRLAWTRTKHAKLPFLDIDKNDLRPSLMVSRYKKIQKNKRKWTRTFVHKQGNKQPINSSN